MKKPLCDHYTGAVSSTGARLERLYAAGKGGIADVHCLGSPRIIPVFDEGQGITQQTDTVDTLNDARYRAEP
jgi:hypothetical protein